MESLGLAVSQHGYSILFLIVLAEALGFPVPAAVGLLVAGGATARHHLDAGEALLVALAAMLIGDNTLFELGRRTGWWLLGVLCRVSLNPEACIMKSADSFYRRGRIMLLFAKFIPGVNTMAPPLAGSMNMKHVEFFALDAGGAALYILTYFGVGYLFSDFLTAILRGYSEFGSVVGWFIAFALALWVANRLRLWFRSRGESAVPMLDPKEIAARDNVAIFDVRSHGYYDEGTMRIRDSIRFEPAALDLNWETLPKDKEIVLYCTCFREATAVRVARILAKRGVPSAVIKGGLSAWKKANLPLEPVPASDVVLLPKFS
ncbi:MAG TPA: VTT domain-containing protein [Bryobacteraceae bacterium]|nr:VTT domain-containing protein [Bryobacteraceae bacterium]